MPRGAGQRRRRAPPTSRRSASPTSARRRWSGTARPARRSTARSSGRTGAPPTSARSCKAAGREPLVAARTGLLLDPYFSGDQDRLAARQRRRRAGARRARRARLRHRRHFLLWRLTGGAVHATDATNASPHPALRHPRGAWDDELLRAVRRAARAAARGARFGRRLRRRPTPSCSARAIAIRGIAGDQQAALFGQACFRAGHDEVDLRHRLLSRCSTPARRRSPRSNRLLTTIAYQLGGETHLRARRLDLRRRRGGAMAARRARHHRAAAAETGALAAAADPAQDGLFWCRPSSASARPIGTPTRAARCSA